MSLPTSMRALRKSSPTPGYSLAEAIYHYHDDDDDDLEEEEDDNVYVEEEMNKSQLRYRENDLQEPLPVPKGDEVVIKVEKVFQVFFSPLYVFRFHLLLYFTRK